MNTAAGLTRANALKRRTFEKYRHWSFFNSTWHPFANSYWPGNNQQVVVNVL